MTQHGAAHGVDDEADDRTTRAEPARPVRVRGRAWVERTGTWHRVEPDADGTLDLAALPADVRTTWVVTDDEAGLLTAARALAPDDRTVHLLGRHLHREGRPRAKVVRGHDDAIVLTAPTVSFVDRTADVHTGWITGVVHPGLVLMTEQGDAGVLAAAAERLEDDLPDPDDCEHAVLATVLLTLTQAAGDVEAEIGDAVARVERTVFSQHAHRDVLADLYDLKREIAEARRALGPVAAALPELVGAAETHARRPEWLRRVEAAVDRIDRHLDAHDALLGDMLAVHLAQVSVQQNEDMRKISAWAAMITVPTLVAGIYGMNFRHMPELGWTYGYPLVLLAMAGACVALWRAFRRSGWL